MKRIKSWFSLSNNRSVRLQHFGSWIAYEDQDTNATYYYNHRTGEGQWEEPEKVRKMNSASSSSSVSVFGKVTRLVDFSCVALGLVT